MKHLHFLSIIVCQTDEILFGDQCIYSTKSDSEDMCSKRKSHKQPEGMSEALALDISNTAKLFIRFSLMNAGKYDTLCFRQGKVLAYGYKLWITFSLLYFQILFVNR